MRPNYQIEREIRINKDFISYLFRFRHDQTLKGHIDYALGRCIRKVRILNEEYKLNKL